ncbi:MAG TPA: 6-hydroxymethylpterin diphosphokinase MptE-like protein [Anaerolineaceae bacterium]|nr:6-hydroxymethylpterin diphosphokinase MptE-like protein [Anaerolineaceae bacterium]
MHKFHNIHSGKRCFIIGNGPSLKQTDLNKLKDEFTFGMNRIYLAFEDLGFSTSYYVSVNDLVIEQCADDIINLKIPRFVSWRSGRKWLSQQENLFFLYTTFTEPKFAKDIRNRLWESATVTYVALQLAFYMGFQEVILIGVDHNFETKGKANTTVVSQGDDPNHFHPGYFGKGFRWQLPDLEMSEVGYQMAKEAFEKDGRKVLDATIGGKLTIFDKVDYNQLF